jgi:hypothetical protein
MMVRDRGPAMAHACGCGGHTPGTPSPLAHNSFRSSELAAGGRASGGFFFSLGGAQRRNNSGLEHLNRNRRRDRDRWSSFALCCRTRTRTKQVARVASDQKCAGEINERSLNLFPCFFCIGFVSTYALGLSGTLIVKVHNIARARTLFA